MSARPLVLSHCFQSASGRCGALLCQENVSLLQLLLILIASSLWAHIASTVISEHLPCARHCSRCWEQRSEWNRRTPDLMEHAFYQGLGGETHTTTTTSLWENGQVQKENTSNSQLWVLYAYSHYIFSVPNEIECYSSHLKDGGIEAERSHHLPRVPPLAWPFSKSLS